MPFAAAGAQGPSPVLLVVFAAGGLTALWCGVNWAFDVRGITTSRSERIRRRWGVAGRPTLFSSAGYLRFLGAVLALAGSVLLLAAYELWHLN
ncbi:hypothetical protein [Streptomyces sp. NPDC001851]|uniref:hypothetical protein n=1 Tax=Streptomyces sp. NPDC001851 TaxID=3154529 RepID=UPI003324B5AC